MLILTLVVGCQYNPYAPLFTTTKPKQEDVAGSYLLTQQTIVPGGLGILKGGQCALDLRGDGTFIVTNYPTWADAPCALDRLCQWLSLSSIVVVSVLAM